MDSKQVLEVLALMDERQAEEVLALIASAIQTANLDYPKMADGTQWDQRVKSNEESRHLTRAVLERLWANGLEIRRRSNACPREDMPCLTVREAFDAMRYFLQAFWERGSRSSEGVRLLLSAMNGAMTKDGGPIDRAQWSDWLDAVGKVEAEARANRH